MDSQLLNNRYRVIKKLGAGGFGNTYLAEDTQMPSQRVCVIKQVKTDNPEERQLIQELFAREIPLVQKIGDNCPQIAQIYAYGAEEGQFYLVEEYIEGITLIEKVHPLRLELFSESSVREILESLLLVLDFVHSQGIIYRNINPDNIILRTSDSQPVLIDFCVGFAKEILVDNYLRVSKRIRICGPQFIPAEQLAGRTDYSSDLYSLGLTAIYLLTGKFPQYLDRDEPIWGNIIVDRETVNPSLADVLEKAVRQHPRDRFPSAKAMLDALQTSTLPATSQKTAPPALKNNSKLIIIGSLIASGLIATAVVIGLLFKQSESPKPIVSPQPSSDRVKSPQT
jgi:serine/threonine protein kinase, bacterial